MVYGFISVCGIVKEADQAGLLTIDRIGNPDEIDVSGWEDQHRDGALATHSTKELTVVNRIRMDATLSSPARSRVRPGVSSWTLLQLSFMARYETQAITRTEDSTAVQAEAECGTDSYSPLHRERAKPSLAGNAALPLRRRTERRANAGFTNDDLVVSKPAEAAVIYGPIWSPSRTPWNPGTIAYSGLVATLLGSGRIQPSGESLSFQVVLSTT
ncbi:hypothetical protein BO83DRAFT_417136 [Aspergillus eucalypticola CBS 122712]|uniref:Uncharacterized protein n=1 Tax=Aspergillus eucalypticola (strain CBS 122712 / IBT 29274) TaxID=1448314 RepID=A0A317VHD7_ASPEC|nr:uncharacterized protein BO83DRAFT_417136 [Aspergillus eucalypticola CBS 122712]PWY73315.1 hypothetical protein BO83DRAFT_417136 [Aspergillus eucalypticola CBS 122712]